MKRNKRIPVGIDDFKKMAAECYFIDKTGFIPDLINNHPPSPLLPAPAASARP